MMTGAGTRKYVANPAGLSRGTLVQLLFEAADRHDKTDALRYRTPDGWRSISHQAFLDEIRLLTLALQSLGLEPGDRLALLSENRPEWALADYATLCMGALDVPIYATLPPNQIAYILKDSGSRAIFVSTAEQLEKVRQSWPELPALERTIVFDTVEVQGPRELTLEQVLERGRAELAAGRGSDFRERALAARPDDLATIIYTSGTTGPPKGVMLTHNNIYSNTQAVRQVLPVGAEDVALSFLPLCHIFERMVDYFLFWGGCTLAYLPSFDLIPQALIEVRPTIVASTPRIYEKLYARMMSETGVKRRLVRFARAAALDWADVRLAGRAPGLRTRLRRALADKLVFRKLRARIGGRLRYFLSGGAPLSPEIARFFYGARIAILEGYGLTETSPVTNTNTPSAFRIGTVGKPVPGTEEMIAEDGEILVRGPQVMKGYYNQPDATRAAIEEDGWFHTGDIGEIDEDGFLRITDRKKDLIVTAGGKNIAPQPIENRVKTNPLVAEAVMLGDRRPYSVLLVVPNFASLAQWAAAHGVTSAEKSELLGDARVRQKMEQEVFGMLDGLARYEMPKKIALLEHEFSIERGELTPTLKVRRRVIEEHFRDLIESLYAEQVTAD